MGRTSWNNLLDPADEGLKLSFQKLHSHYMCSVYTGWIYQRKFRDLYLHSGRAFGVAEDGYGLSDSLFFSNPIWEGHGRCDFAPRLLFFPLPPSNLEQTSISSWPGHPSQEPVELTRAAPAPCLKAEVTQGFSRRAFEQH